MLACESAAIPAKHVNNRFIHAKNLNIFVAIFLQHYITLQK